MKVVVRLGPDGTASAHTEGVLGEGCLSAVPLLEDLLEAVAVDSRYTADFHADVRRQQTQPLTQNLESQA